LTFDIAAAITTANTTTVHNFIDPRIVRPVIYIPSLRFPYRLA